MEGWGAFRPLDIRPVHSLPLIQMIWFCACANQIFFYTYFDFKIPDWSRIEGARAMLSPRGQAKNQDFWKKNFFFFIMLLKFYFWR